MFSRHSSMSQPMTTWKEKVEKGRLTESLEKWSQNEKPHQFLWVPHNKYDEYPENVRGFMNVLWFILEDIPIMPCDSKCYQIDFFHALSHLNDSSKSTFFWRAGSQKPFFKSPNHMTSSLMFTSPSQTNPSRPWQSQCQSSPSPHVPWRTPWCSPGTTSVAEVTGDEVWGRNTKIGMSHDTPCLGTIFSRTIFWGKMSSPIIHWWVNKFFSHSYERNRLFVSHHSP